MTDDSRAAGEPSFPVGRRVPPDVPEVSPTNGRPDNELDRLLARALARAFEQDLDEPYPRQPPPTASA